MFRPAGQEPCSGIRLEMITLFLFGDDGAVRAGGAVETCRRVELVGRRPDADAPRRYGTAQGVHQGQRVP